MVKKLLHIGLYILLFPILCAFEFGHKGHYFISEENQMVRLQRHSSDTITMKWGSAINYWGYFEGQIHRTGQQISLNGRWCQGSQKGYANFRLIENDYNELVSLMGEWETLLGAAGQWNIIKYRQSVPQSVERQFSLSQPCDLN